MNNKRDNQVKIISGTNKFFLKSAIPIFHDVTNGEHVVITLDRIKLIDAYSKNSSDDKNHFLLCLGLFIPTLITLPTVASYSDFLAISGETWKALILIFFLISFVSTCFFGFRFFNNKPFSLEGQILNKK